MAVTVSTWQGVVVVIAVLAVVGCLIVLADRRHRYRKVRFGVFLERERYDDPDDGE